MKIRFLCLVLLLGLPVWAAKIPIGELRYLGDTPDGHSVFRVRLNPPAGIDLTKFTHTIYLGAPDVNVSAGLTFVLPSPVPPAQPPLTYQFVFLTGYGQFGNCPCASAAYVFYAQPKSTITYNDGTFTVKAISASFLRPLHGEDAISVQQASTIYLYVDED